MKYKQEYLELKDKVSDLEWDLKVVREGRDKANSMVTKLEGQINGFEGRESDVRRENEWLKTTLRLVVVDSEKIKNLVGELEIDTNGLRLKF